MSNAGSKKNKRSKQAKPSKKVKLWFEYDEPAPNARTEALLAAIEAGLVRFDHHKEGLLTILRDRHNRGPKSELFDETKSWSSLTTLAHSFFWRVNQETMPAADRKARLRTLATVLKRSHTIVDEAMQNDVGDDLFSAWCEESDEPLMSLFRNDDGSFAAVRMPEEGFKKAVANLAALATAAQRAANEAHKKRPGRGRPKGTTVLPTGYIEVLATLYRERTGAKPGTGPGPFVRFVSAFLTAIGAANISEGYVVELAQAASSSARTHPSGWAPSPFDK